MSVINETPQAEVQDSGKVIGWLDKLLALEQRYGVAKILVGIVMLFFMITLTTVAFNPTIIVNAIEKVQQKAHNEGMQKRLAADPIIRSNLAELRLALSASRTFVLETHNGGTNLTNLPFLYIDMTYEDSEPGTLPLETDYKNFRLSRYPFSSELYSCHFWFGSVEQMETIDKELSYRMYTDGTKYMGLMVLYGAYNPCGVLGVIYSDENHPNAEVINVELQKHGARIAALLNNER